MFLAHVLALKLPNEFVLMRFDVFCQEKRRRDRQSQLIAVSSPRQGKMDAPLISENGGPLLDLEQNNADQTADHKA